MNQVTVLGLGLLLACVGLYDLVLAVRGDGDTLSAIIRSWSHQYPFLPFAAGALAAHLFGF